MSEHLAYSAVPTVGESVNVGLTLPVVLEQETIDLVGARVHYILERLGRPVLLENNVYYFVTCDQPMTEPQVLNELSAVWGASVLLDLHNLCVNVANGVTNADDYLESIDLSSVREVHIAGGMELDGFMVDAHCGAPPTMVWDLLDAVVPNCPNLGAVTFEVLGSWVDHIGFDVVGEVVRRAQAVMRTPSGRSS